MNGSSHLLLFTTTIFYFSHLAECGFFSVGTLGSSCFRGNGLIFQETRRHKKLKQISTFLYLQMPSKKRGFRIDGQFTQLFSKNEMRFFLTCKSVTQNLKKCLVPSNMTITRCFFMPNRDCFSGLLPSCMPPFEEKDFLVRMQQHESSEQAREEMEKRTANWHKKREGSRKEKWSRHDFIC